MATAVRDTNMTGPCAWPVVDSMEDTLRSARRAVTDARHAAEDFAAGTALEVRRHPLRTMGIAAGGGVVAGALAGFAAGWFFSRRG